MNEYEKIHEITKELLPFWEEAGPAARKIMEEHLAECQECSSLLESYEQLMGDGGWELGDPPPAAALSTAPFKNLVYFKRILFIALIIARVMILALLSKNWIASGEISRLPLLTADLILYYFPFAALVDSIMFMAYRKKWFWATLILDILILVFFDNVIQFILT